MRRIISLLCLTFVFSSFATQEPSITFRQNKGQWPKKVSFSADLPTGQVFIEENCLTWRLFSISDLKKAHDAKFGPDKSLSGANDLVRSHVYKVEFLNADLVRPSATGIQPEYYNYFLGNDPAQWASHVKAYKDVVFKDIYPNIDAHFYGRGNFEYDLIIKPGASVSDIKLKYQYVSGLALLNNKLVIQTSVGDVVENIPEAYQFIKGKKVKVECAYVLKGEEVSFKLGAFDPKVELIIDPVVVVSSYSGTEGVTYGLGVTPDENGNIFLYSLDVTRKYPITPGAIQTTIHGSWMDVALSKFNAAGNAKRFSTYIGGNSQDQVINCVIQKNELAVFGITRSDTFPLISTGFQTTFGGVMDYFIIKLDTSGSTLIASTYLGGDHYESSSTVGNGSALYNLGYAKGEMIMDPLGDCYVFGCTSSMNYPTTPGSYREYNDSNGYNDLVITKLSKDLSTNIWSTYYGGSAAQGPTNIRLSKTGIIYCGATTNSRNFPTTPGVVHTTSVSSLDMAVFSMDPANGFPIASSYVGSKSTEALRFDIDQNDNVYLVGHCFAPSTITVTPGAYNSNSGNEVFYKLDPNFTSVSAIARFGYNNANNKIEIDAMNVDSCGYVYFGGFALPGLPVTSDAFKSISAPNGNMYLGMLSPGFTFLKFGSYYGGTADKYMDHDDGGSNYFDDKGYFYHAVCVEGDWPVTAGAYSGYNVKDSVNYGSDWFRESDAFVKIDLRTFMNVTSSTSSEMKPCGPTTQTFKAYANAGAVTIIPGDGSPAVVANSLVHTYSVQGTYTAYIISEIDASTCNIADTVKILVSTEDNSNDPHDYSTPNAFTPNGDGTNDSFCLKGWNRCNLSFKIMIFDRWGGKVFESDDPEFCWDGKSKGNLLSSDVYIYQITASYEGDIRRTKKGNITLIR